MANLTIREFKHNFLNCKYSTVNDLLKNGCGGWYDWFCSNQSLVSRTKKMYNFLKGIDNPYILDNFRVWFKNNCPMVGPTYDDCRFEPLDESKRDEMFFGVKFNCSYETAPLVVFTARSGYQTEFKFNNMKELREFLSTWQG